MRVSPAFFSKACLAAVCMGAALTASAHQPNYVGQRTSVVDAEPLVSKAYYGELAGQPAIYIITATSSMLLDVSILAPDVPGAHKDFIVNITTASGTIAALNDPAVPWQRWYEEFGGDWYWQGPEFKQEVPAGTYAIIVRSQENAGKYSLAIGEDESFPPGEALHTIAELYAVKTQFFGKPWYAIFGGVIGKFLLGIVIALLVIVIVVLWLALRFMKRRRQPTSA